MSKPGSISVGGSWQETYPHKRPRPESCQESSLNLCTMPSANAWPPPAEWAPKPRRRPLLTHWTPSHSPRVAWPGPRQPASVACEKGMRGDRWATPEAARGGGGPTFPSDCSNVDSRKLLGLHVLGDLEW